MDGLFHALTSVVTLVGTVLLLTAARPRAGVLSAFLAGLLIGWGLFNVAEGLVDHHILGLHHVRLGPDALAYDLGFLALGAAMVVVGTMLWRVPGRRTSAAHEPH